MELEKCPKPVQRVVADLKGAENLNFKKVVEPAEEDVGFRVYLTTDKNYLKNLDDVRGQVTFIGDSSKEDNLLWFWLEHYGHTICVRVDEK